MKETPLDPELLLSQTGWIRNLALSLVDPSRAEDVVQETMLTALHVQAADRGTPGPTSLRAWLARVVRNKAYTILRSDGRRKNREQFAARRETSQAPSPSELGERSEQIRLVVEGVVGLSEPYRSTLLLRYFDGLKTEEIAEALQITPEAARQRISRALRKLRNGLDQSQGGDGKTWRSTLLPLTKGIGSPLEPSSPPFPWASSARLVLSAAALLSPFALWMLWPKNSVPETTPRDSAIAPPPSRERQWSVQAELELERFSLSTLEEPEGLNLTLRLSTTQEIETKDDLLDPTSAPERRRSTKAIRATTHFSGTIGSPSPSGADYPIEIELAGHCQTPPPRKTELQAPLFPLSDREPATGDEWGVPLTWLETMLFPVGKLSFEAPAPQQHTGLGFQFWNPADWLGQNLEGTITARSRKESPDKGKGVGRADLTLEIVAYPSLLERYRDLHGALAVAPGTTLSLDEMTIKSTYDASGEVLWDLDDGEIRSVWIEGSLRLEILQELALDDGITQKPVARSQVWFGRLRIENKTESRDLK